MWRSASRDAATKALPKFKCTPKQDSNGDALEFVVRNGVPIITNPKPPEYACEVVSFLQTTGEPSLSNRSVSYSEAKKEVLVN